MHQKVVYHLIYILLLFFALPLSVAGKDFVLVIDAGHGGKDAGAIGTYSKEKNINLNVALKVGELIQKNCSDVKLIFTRKTDVFVELDERANIANRAKADLFISVHTNAVEKGNDVVGSETYSLGMARANENLDVAKRENSVILYEKNYQERYAGFNPNSSESYIIFDYMQDQYMKQSAELANNIQRQYASNGRPNKGVHQAGFLVLRKTSMPSVLTELGFITTPQEEQYLNSEKGTDELALSIYRGFMEYRNTMERHKSVVLTYADEKKAQQDSEKDKAKQESDTKENTDQGNNQTNEKQDADSQPDTKIPSVETNPQKVENKATEETIKVEPSVHKKAKQEAQDNKADNSNKTPVFKIQFLTAGRMLRAGSSQFKGLEKVDYYLDKNIYKYTYGSTTSYSEILTLRKSIVDKFPDCFVVAFNGKDKMSLQEAIKNNKK